MRSTPGIARIRLGLALACAWLVAPPAPAQHPTPTADAILARGAVLYRIHRASCHGPEGKGDGPVAAVLTTAPPDLTVLARESGGRFPEDDVRAVIDGRTDVRAHGVREMPVWGLSFAEAGRDASQEREIEAEIRALVRYLASIQRR